MSLELVAAANQQLTERDIWVVACTNPFTFERLEATAPTGTSIRQIVDSLGPAAPLYGSRRKIT